MSELPNGSGNTRPAVSSSAVPPYNKPLIGHGGTEGGAGAALRSFSSMRIRNFAAKDHGKRYRAASVFDSRSFGNRSEGLASEALTMMIEVVMTGPDALKGGHRNDDSSLVFQQAKREAKKSGRLVEMFEYVEKKHEIVLFTWLESCQIDSCGCRLDEDCLR